MRTTDELARTLAMLPDNPNRVAPPDFEPERPDFEQLPIEQRLDAAERLCRRNSYRTALPEALVEHDRYDSLMAMVLDSACPNEVIGQLVREMTLDYLKDCAELQGEDIRDMA